MVWNVFYHNINADKIEIYNIFDHPSFRNGVDRAFKQCKTKEEFVERIHIELYRHFGAKAEWEVVVRPWCGSRSNDSVKIDVRDQVMLNWNTFIDYLWGQRL